MSSRGRSNLHKGQYLFCRFDGEGNGDIVVGRIESVRGGGLVIIRNLLTDGLSTKLERVVLERNVVVPKRKADELLERSKKYPAETRHQACRSEALRMLRQVDCQPDIAAAVEAIRKLPLDERQRLHRILWDDCLEAFGVQ